MSTLSVSEATVKEYNLSITTRDFGDDPTVMEELTYATVKTWLWVVNHLEQGDYTLPTTPDGDVLGSVEQILAARITDTDSPKTFPPTGGDARVTVWDTYRGNKRISFHLDSDDIPQVVVNLWVAQRHALERIFNEFAAPQQQVQKAAQNGSNIIQDGATSVSRSPMVDKPATPRGTTEMPNTPAPAVEGAIVATRPPNANRPDYANGQLVSFTVTKIVASSNKGSAVYQMWTPLGTQYPTISVYKMDTKGKEKPDYKAIVGILATLNLSLDKPEAMGTWRLICKAAHVPNADGADREYLNVVSLTAI